MPEYKMPSHGTQSLSEFWVSKIMCVTWMFDFWRNGETITSGIKEGSVRTSIQSTLKKWQDKHHAKASGENAGHSHAFKSFADGFHLVCKYEKAVAESCKGHSHVCPCYTNFPSLCLFYYLAFTFFQAWKLRLTTTGSSSLMTILVLVACSISLTRLPLGPIRYPWYRCST